jgi:hypothetical protein
MVIGRWLLIAGCWLLDRVELGVASEQNNCRDADDADWADQADS